MRKYSEKIPEVSMSKKFIASTIMVLYFFVTSPLALFAESSKKKTEIKRNVFVKEDKAEVLISAKEGGTVTLGEASIEIPEGALKEDTKISITRLYKVEDTGESLYNAIPHSGGYRFLPAGTKFLKDVTITLPYSAELNAKPQSLDELYTYFYDTQKNCWIKLERLEVDKEHNKVRSLSTHFTDMINATLTMPESASPVDVNLNSIKNLEAAKPDSHLIKFNPPKASNMGDATFSFELAVPAGRRGMQPQIAVSYSSADGNGIMGKGFDVSYGSSITTDTRFGLPKYDTHDTYMLDGVLLEEKSREGNEITYKPLKETSFSRIKRYMSDNHWEVTDKNGTKRLYAQTEKSCVGKGDETFTWNITKIEDINNNNVIFEYNNFDESQGKETYNYVYPTAVYYTGYKTEKGKYKIQFHYDNDGTESRQDVRIDARSKQIIACKKLLTGITTHYGNETTALRTYSFTYKEGLAKEKMLTALTVSNNADESYEYTFDYNEPKVVDGKVEYFAEAEKWDNGMSLKAGRSSSGGAIFNANSGVGVGGSMADGRLTGGTQGSSINSQSETESMLADIDGDGSPDYISVRGSTLYYRLNTKNGFAEEKKISLEKIKLNAESSSSFSIGWNIYGGSGLKKMFVSGVGATYSYVNQKTTSRSTVELCDVDSDRKTDIILSGKNYYLKNTSENGKISFRQELYDDKNSTAIENNIKKPTADEISNYKKEYKIQTPFRQWKAEYDGNVTVVQNFSTADSFDKSNSVKAHVYKGKSENAESSLESTVSGNFFSQKTKGNLSVTKGENLYFITETEEPIGADVNYNVKINYTDIYSYKPRLLSPVFFPQKEFLKKYDETYSSISVIKKSDLSCPKDLESIYDNPETVIIKENETEKKYSVCTLKDNWIKDADEKVYSYLIKNGMFLPEAFTETQFEKILESFSSHSGEVMSRGYFKKEDEDKIKEEVIYERFAEKFIHDLTDRIYIIRKNNDRELFDLIYNVLDQKEILSESWNNYRLFDVDAVYNENGIVYEQKSNVAEGDRVRKNDAAGTQLQDGNLIVLADYNGKLLTASRKDGKVFLDGNEQSEFSAEFDLKDFEDKKENKLIVSLTHVTDGERIIYEFSGFMPKAWNITKAEMQAIADDYSMTGESLADPYWNWNEKTEEEALGFLKSFGMDTNQQDRFLELAYDKSVKEITEDGEVKESSVFTKKQNISADNFAEAENILSAVKFKRVTENEFPYYEKLNEEEFILKKEYDDDETENKELIEKCNEHGLGKFCSVQDIIRYDENGLYNLDDNGEFVTRRFIENSISVKDEKYLPGQISWDSSSAWNGRENEEEKVLYKYGSDENESVIQLERREKFYPGSSNWFFGIWINGKKPFSGQYIEELLSAKYGEQINYDANKLSKMTEKEAEVEKGNNMEIPFYLPVCNTDIEGSQIYPVKKE